jgi:homoserine kinase
LAERVPLQRARVRVPCSTSNLGAGFDCVGLAFDRFLEATYTPGNAPLAVERSGTLSRLRGGPADDLLATAFLRTLASLGAGPAARSIDGTGTIHVESAIPVARGLGSSAAAVVGGMLLAHAAAGQALPDRHALLAGAAAAEGHPDNVAPALFGGLVVVVPAAGGGLRLLRHAVSPEISFIFAAPDVEVPTPLARRALPASVPYAAAIGAAPRLAALLRGLESADGELLAIGFSDELHVPYRLPLIPRGEAALAAARDAGAWAATISGSGSGIIAAAPAAAADAVRAALLEVFAGHGGEACAFRCAPDPEGAVLS